MGLSKETYASRKAAGLCLQCGKSAGGLGLLCEPCKAKGKACRLARYAKRKAAGLCVSCPNISMPGCSVCEECSKRSVAANGRQYRRRRAAGLCPYCGKELQGQFQCDNCTEKARVHKRQRYRRRRLDGLCTFCDAMAMPGHTACAVCNAEHAEYSRQRWKKIVQQVFDHYGCVCADCGEKDVDLLQIDHKDGGGNEHRRQIGQGNLYRWLIAQNFPEGFQTLCANCNWKKRIQDKRRKLEQQSSGAATFPT